METSRRNFIKTSALAVAGTALLRNELFAAPKQEVVGLQLYSVRDAMKADAFGTLKKLSDSGYRNIEHAGYGDRKFYGVPVAEFKRRLDDMGLKMVSGHSVMSASHWDNAKNDFTDAWKYTIEDAAIVGQHFVISPGLDEDVYTDAEARKRMMHQFNKCGELCKAHGMQFGYHNHNKEFTTTVGLGNLYDYMLQNTDAKLVTQQMDIGNMVATGSKPIDYLKKYPGRFRLVHAKDEIKSEGRGDLGDGYDSCILGEGIMPLKEILTVARNVGGVTHFMIEQESYQGKDPVNCVKIDLQIMNKWGYR